MDSIIAWELLAILLLILWTGLLAIAEVAIVSADRDQLERLASQGNRAARIALDLGGTAQEWFGILRATTTTLAVLAACLAAWYFRQPLVQAFPDPWPGTVKELLALTIIAGGLSFLAVVVGDILPQHIAAHYAVPWAAWMARPVWWLRRCGAPVQRSVQRVLALLLPFLRLREAPPVSITRRDIESLIERSTEAGIVQPLEKKLAVEALRLGEQQVRQIMRPRIEIDAADIETPPEEILGVLAMAGFSRIPVYEGDLDHIIGVVHLKDVLRQQYLGWEMTLRKLAHPPLFVPETFRIDQLLALCRERREHLAIVVDEYGATRGMVTIEDVLRELVGEAASRPATSAVADIVRRDDGTWLVDGMVTIENLLAAIGKQELMEQAPVLVQTIAGLLLLQLNHLPHIGEKTNWHGLQLEVVDMDGNRIDRVLVSSASTETGAESEI